MTSDKLIHHFKTWSLPLLEVGVTVATPKVVVMEGRAMPGVGRYSVFTERTKEGQT